MKIQQKFTFRNVLVFILWTNLIIFSFSDGVLATAEYEVQHSWFIDMTQYTDSAHGKLHCVQCHDSVEKQDEHPSPGNVTKSADAFFQIKQCAGSDCHDNTLKDLDTETHGRIKFKNRHKYQFCIDCHDPHLVKNTQKAEDRLSKISGREACLYEDGELSNPSAKCLKDEDCLVCHRQVTDNAELAVVREANLCFKCHNLDSDIHRSTEKINIPPIKAGQYRKTAHAGIRCTECHTKSASFEHQKKTVPCADCHVPHDEGMIHDSHSTVTCQACHLPGNVTTEKILEERIIWEKERRPKRALVTIHDLVTTEIDDNCTRCHIGGNSIGAASMVLPAKSVICMACHTSTFSIGDPITLITLLVFILVMAGLISVWMTGERHPRHPVGLWAKLKTIVWTILGVIFSQQIIRIFKAILLDAVLQRKLFGQSKFRWLSHSLILYGFLLRLAWGLIALMSTLLISEWQPAWSMVNKNHPLTAFLFDATGIMIVLGVIMILIRKFHHRKKKWPGLPRQEWLSLSLIGSIVIVGYLLEGMRIAMTIESVGEQYAFIGYAMSRIFYNIAGLTDIYGYIWYLHAILTGVFVVWLPFSRMFHIVMAPIAIAINAVWHQHGPDNTHSVTDKETV